jgi:hypothetical protein
MRVASDESLRIDGRAVLSGNPSRLQRSVKQSSTVEAARTARGLSPWPPEDRLIRSLCSTLVGRPVLGPPRWTLITMSGISAIEAQPMASLLKGNSRPGASGHRQVAGIGEAEGQRGKAPSSSSA